MPPPPSSTSPPPRQPRSVPCSTTPATPATSTPSATRPSSPAPRTVSTTSPPSRASTPRTPSRTTSSTPPPRPPTSALTSSADTQAPLHPSQRRLGQRPSQCPRLLRHLLGRQAGRPGSLLRRLPSKTRTLGELAQSRPLRHRPQARAGAPLHQRRRTHHLHRLLATPATPTPILRQHRHHPRSQWLQRHRPGPALPPQLDDSALQPRRALLPVRLHLPPSHHRSLRLPLRERARQLHHPDFCEDERIQRTNFQYTLQFQRRYQEPPLLLPRRRRREEPPLRHRRNPASRSRLVPVRPGRALVPRHPLRANVATGVQEPILAIEFSSLYTQLLARRQHRRHRQLPHHTPRPQRSRTYDIGIDQNILGEKLILKAGYFHNQFSHQPRVRRLRRRSDTTSASRPPSPQSLLLRSRAQLPAFRAQGLETELQYQPSTRLFLRGGYTYLATLVEQSFASTPPPPTAASHRQIRTSPASPSAELALRRQPRLPPPAPHRLLRAQYTARSSPPPSKAPSPAAPTTPPSSTAHDPSLRQHSSSSPIATWTSATPSSISTAPTPPIATSPSSPSSPISSTTSTSAPSATPASPSPSAPA